MVLNLKQVAQKLFVVYQDLDQAQQVAGWLLEKLTGRSYAQVLVLQDLKLDQNQQALLERWLDQIINKHMPVQYILGNVPFLDLDILVQPPVLIPRLETEWWVNNLISSLLAQNKLEIKILDLCSGSGCIGLALAKALPKSQVIAVDISQAACALIAKNKQHNAIHNLQVMQGDLYQKLDGYQFDLIVSNPPYIRAQDYQNLDLSVRLWEDRQALVAPDFDLAIITKIIDQAPNYLQKKQLDLPNLWLEIDDDIQSGQVVLEIMQTKFDYVELMKDQFGRQRVVVGK